MATAGLKVRCYVAGEVAVTTAQTQTDIYVSSLKSWMCGFSSADRNRRLTVTSERKNEALKVT